VESVTEQNGPESESSEVVVDTRIYTPEALFRACYVFTDRAYLFLSEAGEDRVLVEFRSRGSGNAASLASITGEFSNELIKPGCALCWRSRRKGYGK